MEGSWLLEWIFKMILILRIILHFWFSVCLLCADSCWQLMLCCFVNISALLLSYLIFNSFTLYFTIFPLLFFFFHNVISENYTTLILHVYMLHLCFLYPFCSSIPLPCITGLYSQICHACHRQPPLQRGLHQHHHLLHRGAANGKPGLSFGGGRGSPPAVAGAGEKPSQSLQAKLHTPPQPQSRRPGRSSHPALCASGSQFSELGARWWYLRPPGIHDFSDCRSGDLQPGGVVSAEVSYCCTTDATTY